MLALIALWGCGTEGCLGGEDGCRVEPPCTALAFNCEAAGPARHYRVEPGGVELTNNNSVMSVGDWVLRNQRVMVVISDLPHPHYIAPTGGNLVDLVTLDADGQPRQEDSTRNIYQVAGLLPTEAFAYTSIEAFMDGEHAVVQVAGSWDDDPDVRVYTRYELGPCDPGVRVRTELVNLNDDAESVFLADVLYIGSRELLSFSPGEGLGMDHPSFGLTTLSDGLRDVPWVAAGARERPSNALSFTACDAEHVVGLFSEEITAIAKPLTLLRYGDWLTHERFIGIGTGSSVAAGADIAMQVREQLLDEATSQVTVQLTHAEDDGQGFRSGRPHALVYAGDVTVGATREERAQLTAVTHAEPDEDGRMRFAVPRGGVYTVHIERFGLPWARATVDAEAATAEVTIELPAPARAQLAVTVDGAPDHALVMVWPADDATLEAVRADYLDHFETCAPMLGHPYGGGPSCNRVLLDGEQLVELPPGRYDFSVVAGPFSTLSERRDVELLPWRVGEPPVPIQLDVQTLPLLGADQLTADFHVHGSASFDAAIPDDDRVRSFLASRVDVIAATDHDQVHDYAATMDALGAHERIELLIGLETTGHLLQPLLDSSDFPKVVGHWIVWPLPFDPEAPWRGAPWDEKALPGQLFTRFEDAGWPADSGVIQLNHPWGGVQFGRDFAWPTALEMDLTQPLDGDDVPEGHRLFRATPPGARFANDAYHVQEVMNGTNNGQLLQYRAVWHYLLNQGVVRAGTANSDSHALGGNLIGFPVNVVRTREVVGDFDQPTFNAAVRAGRMFGTSGPALRARIVDGETTHEPRIDRAIDARGELRVDVQAAEWVPLDEVRVYVDGEMVQQQTLTPTAVEGVPGAHGASLSWPLDALLDGPGDHWINVEAGAPLPLAGDLSCNGVPDTTDNNGDRVVDWQDVAAYTGLTEPPPQEHPGCFAETGPLVDTAPREGLPRTAYEAVAPGGYPYAFTNPFLIDGDGDGAFRGVSR